MPPSLDAAGKQGSIMDQVYQTLKVHAEFSHSFSVVSGRKKKHLISCSLTGTVSREASDNQIIDYAAQNPCIFPFFISPIHRMLIKFYL